jgi:hypothetical protein
VRGPDGRAIREELAGVVEDDDTVAEQRPALLGVRGDHRGGPPVRP